MNKEKDKYKNKKKISIKVIAPLGSLKSSKEIGYISNNKSFIFSTSIYWVPTVLVSVL